LNEVRPDRRNVRLGIAKRVRRRMDRELPQDEIVLVRSGRAENELSVIIVQACDAVIGTTIKDRMKTFGPAGTALLNLLANPSCSTMEIQLRGDERN